ncbi:hypothetical protein D3C72_1349350 [compost metagenome]
MLLGLALVAAFVGLRFSLRRFFTLKLDLQRHDVLQIAHGDFQLPGAEQAPIVGDAGLLQARQLMALQARNSGSSEAQQLFQIAFAVQTLQQAVGQREAARYRFGADLAEHAEGVTDETRQRLRQGVGGDDCVETGAARQTGGQLCDQLEQIGFHVRCQRRVLPGQQFAFEEHAAVGQGKGHAFGGAQLLHVREAGKELVDHRA